MPRMPDRMPPHPIAIAAVARVGQKAKQRVPAQQPKELRLGKPVRGPTLKNTVLEHGEQLILSSGCARCKSLPPTSLSRQRAQRHAIARCQRLLLVRQQLVDEVHAARIGDRDTIHRRQDPRTDRLEPVPLITIQYQRLC